MAEASYRFQPGRSWLSLVVESQSIEIVNKGHGGGGERLSS